jgi:2,3-bisphosphoglycerate-independent phosphoglycerate mutase
MPSERKMQKNKHKSVLVITDGIGHNPDTENNAFAQASTPTYDKLMANTPHSLINTSGEAVGLPHGQMGNSEVGHMTLGSGRVLEQNLVRITHALESGKMADDDKLKTLFYLSNNIHLVGLLSDGGVHSHIDHIIGLARLAVEAGKYVFIHVITDGRDVAPSSALQYLSQLQQNLDENMTIATISGRYFTMDRDRRWDRVELGYRAIAEGIPRATMSPSAYIESQYKSGISDEFIEPIALAGYDGFEHCDGVIFCNFRSDRMREIVRATGDEKFEYFKRPNVAVRILTMTEYDKTFNFPALFGPLHPENTLSQVISNAGLRQFHTAETEKYAHVTFFFNGGIEKPCDNEVRKLIPSPKIKTYDLQPEMNASGVGDAVIDAIHDGFDFVLVNFANADMVGHTGNFNASMRAVEAVDEQLGRILEVVRAEGYSIVITSDHGNVEKMSMTSGEMVTSHTTCDVYCFVVDEEVTELRDGSLANIAPTILRLMHLPIPGEMEQALI